MSGWRKSARLWERQKYPLSWELGKRLWALSPNAETGTKVELDGQWYRLGERSYLSRSGYTRTYYSAWHETKVPGLKTIKGNQPCAAASDQAQAVS